MYIPRRVFFPTQCRFYSSMIDQIIADIANETAKKNHNSSVKIQAPFTKSSSKILRSIDERPPRARNNNNRNNFVNRQPFNNRRKQKQPADYLNLKTGSDRLQQAFLATHKQIREINPRGRVIVIRTSGLQKQNITELAQELNLDDEGIEVVRVEEERGESLPLLKIVTAKRAGEAYSDLLHEQMTKNTGLVARGHRSVATKDPSLKQYKLSWNLSLNDLSNVKLKEIWNQMLKGHKIEIYLADRRDMRNLGANFISEREEEEPRHRPIDEIERIKREKLVETILQFVEQQQSHKVELTQRGSVDRRMLFTMKLEKITQENGNDTEKSKLKEQKKAERRERERLKALRKSST